MKRLFRNLPLLRAFTLLEVMVTVAIISTVAAGAIYVATNASQNANATKLQRDVATLNRALRTYELNGGSLDGIRNPQSVLNKLKTATVGDNRKEIAGIRGAMVDPRMAVKLQSRDDAATGMQRARYMSDLKQFVIESNGAVGIQEFFLDDALADVDYGSEERQADLKLAKEDPWVWDFDDITSASRTGPAAMPSDPSVALPPTPPASNPLPLDPPTYNRASGSYPLTSFPLAVTINNPNASGIAEILYNVGSGPWQSTSSGAVLFDPGSDVSAFAVSLDPDKYEDSASVSRTYTTTPETPAFSLTFNQAAYSYTELGGVLMAGSPAASPTPVAGTLALTNAGSIPLAYQSNTVFQPGWTFDGSSPLSSSTTQNGPVFSGGYPGDSIPLNVDLWGTAKTLTVIAASRTLRPAILTDSTPQTKVVRISKITLPKPELTLDERDLILDFDLASGNIPEGAQIYYSLDGVDPGNVNGAPSSGTLYDGPVFISGVMGDSIRITARVYPPAKYVEWFNPSLPAEENYVLPAGTDVYVGGDFYSPSGSSMRNIARLAGDGKVDPRFNTGAGASTDSLVGVIRQMGGGVMAGGDFAEVNAVPRAGVVRLNGSGAVDASFDAGLSGNP